MLTHLLDTSVYTQRLRRDPAASVMERWRRAGDASLAISSICEAEVLYGLERKASERMWTEYHEYLKDRFVVLPVDQQVAGTFAELKVELERRGTPRADFDLLIAATGVVHRLAVATLNIRHFEGIPGLRAEDWASP